MPSFCLRATFPFRAGTLFPVRRAGLPHRRCAVARCAPSTPMPTTSRRTSCAGRTVVVRARPPRSHGADPAPTAAHSAPWGPPSPDGALARAARSPVSREHPTPVTSSWVGPTAPTAPWWCARPPRPHGANPAPTAAHSALWEPPSPPGALARAARSPGSRGQRWRRAAAAGAALASAGVIVSTLR